MIEYITVVMTGIKDGIGCPCAAIPARTPSGQRVKAATVSGTNLIRKPPPRARDKVPPEADC